MRSNPVIPVCVLIALVAATSAVARQDRSASPAMAPANAYHVVKTIAVPGEGRWDCVTVDPDSHRLYVPRATHTQVIDLESGKVESDWPDTAGVHGVALVPTKNLAFTSNGRTGTVSVFDTKTNQKIADVKAGTGPDVIVYDEASGRVLCMNHRGGTITLISPGAALNQFDTKELEIGGALEFAAVDGEGHAFVNVEDKNEVVEIDTRQGTVMKHWPTTGGQGPTGVAIDPKRHRLFVGCGENDKLVIMDSTNGDVITVLPIGSRCDGCAFDPGTGEAFAACGDGTVAVIREGADGKYEVAETVKTKVGARTIAIDPKLHTLYLPTAEFQSSGTTRPTMQPGTFQIVVVAK